jgi:EpsI family protein
MSQPFNTMSGFLRSKTLRVLSAVLLVQVFLTYGMSRKEVVPSNRKLTDFASRFGTWTLYREGIVDKDTQDVLRADEVFTRSYYSPEYPVAANLFVAYFRTQRTGQTPHSPKNCLPGNGWIQSSSTIMNVDIPGRTPIEVNHYLVAKGDEKSVVMYWYQSRDRVVASEYKSKVHSVLDAIRYNRSDIAIVRVVVPVIENRVDDATKEGINYIQSFYSPLRQHFPA